MVSCSYPFHGEYTPLTGESGKHFCLLFSLPFPLVVPVLYLSSLQTFALGYAKVVSCQPIKRNYVVFSGKISTLPARAKKHCGRSYFSFKSLRFSKNLHSPFSGKRCHGGSYFLKKICLMSGPDTL